MFEFDKYEKHLHLESTKIQQGQYDPVKDITEAAILVWGEHCIECAAPSCYESCDLYERRPDHRCRRFSYGVFRNPGFTSFRGYGAEISFKKWGKIETRGNTAMLPLKAMLLIERIIMIFSLPLNGFGVLIYQVTRDSRWRYLTHLLLERFGRWLHRKSGQKSKPDAFLLEIYNPSPNPVQIHFCMGIARSELKPNYDESRIPPSFRTEITLKPGYTKQQFDRLLFKSVTDCGLPFDISLGPEAESYAKLIVLSADFVKNGGHSCDGTLTRPKIKCVVFDLDNTLWDGVLMENDKLKLNQNILELIHNLDGRGILLSIASKNNFDDAWSHIEHLGVSDYFLYPQINWIAKSENIKIIAEKLNIGLDTFAFVDDNPFELEQVSQTLPEVACININEIDHIERDSRFDIESGEDTRNRRQYYKDAIQRDEQQNNLNISMSDFLASCEIELSVSTFIPENFQRIVELVQRTNQLNFSGKNYNRDDISTLLADDSYEKHVLKCSDKYGSYGTVGFSLVRRSADEIRVEDFMLSCRVQGKFIEQAFFAHLIEAHESPTLSRLWVNFQPTQRNKPAEMTLQSLEFQKSNSTKGGRELDTTVHPIDCPFIKVL